MYNIESFFINISETNKLTQKIIFISISFFLHLFQLPYQILSRESFEIL